MIKLRYFLLFFLVFFSGCSGGTILVNQSENDSIKVNVSNSDDLKQKEVDIKGVQVTSFNELLVAEKTNRFNFLSIDSPNKFREDIVTNGSNAVVDNVNGEIRLNPGNESNGEASIRTSFFGRYIAGLAAEFGIGFRMEDELVGNQYVEFGYYFEENGIGYGRNSDCFYTFVIDSGNKDITCQDNWNIDNMDGTGPSGAILNISSGNIYQGDFEWYGFGDIAYVLNVKNASNPLEEKKNYIVHLEKADGRTTFENPNQPIKVKVSNNGTSGNPVDVFVGGRQFSIVGGEVRENQRPVAVALKDYTVTSTSYEPIMAIRKSPNHPVYDGVNSINVFFNRYDFSDISNNLDIKVTYNAEVLNANWQKPPSWGNESAAEVAFGNETLQVNSSEEGYIFSTRSIQAGSQQKSVDISEDSQVVIGIDKPIVVWARKDSQDVDIGSISIEWLELW